MKGSIVDDQRDYKEEAANERMMREEAEQELAAEQRETYPLSDIEIGSLPSNELVTCGTCGRSFPDIYPSARCPFEYEHAEILAAKPLTANEQFFYDNAGYSYDPKTETAEDGRKRMARELAAAEDAMKKGPYFISVERDPEPYDGDMPYDGPMWIVELMSVKGSTESELVGSVGGVACYEETDPYIRVIGAELAREHLPEEIIS